MAKEKKVGKQSASNLWLSVDADGGIICLWNRRPKCVETEGKRNFVPAGEKGCQVLFISPASLKSLVPAGVKVLRGSLYKVTDLELTEVEA